MSGLVSKEPDSLWVLSLQAATRWQNQSTFYSILYIFKVYVKNSASKYLCHKIIDIRAH